MSKKPAVKKKADPVAPTPAPPRKSANQKRKPPASETAERKEITLTQSFEIGSRVSYRRHETNPMLAGVFQGVIAQLGENGELLIATDEDLELKRAPSIRVWANTTLVTGPLAPDSAAHGFAVAAEEPAPAAAPTPTDPGLYDDRFGRGKPSPAAEAASRTVTPPPAIPEETSRDTALPFALVYKAPPYYQVPELLTETFGPAALKLSHAKGDEGKTLYCFVTNMKQPEIEKRLQENKHRDLFGETVIAPTAEEMEQAKANSSTGKLALL